jgi:hypothetical protein
MDHSYAQQPQPKCILCMQDSGDKLTVVTLGLHKIRESAVIRNAGDLIEYLDSTSMNVSLFMRGADNCSTTQKIAGGVRTKETFGSFEFKKID